MNRTMMWTLLVALAVAPAAMAQSEANAPVGTLQYVEGKVWIGNQPVRAGGNQRLPVVEPRSVLRTGDGHAEMLLTPGVFLRLGVNSEVEMISASLTDTAVSLRQGVADVEVNELHKENSLRVENGPGSVTILKTGLYRFQADPASVLVVAGKVETQMEDLRKDAGKNREITFGGDLSMKKVRGEPADELARWSRLRSQYESEASAAAAQYVADMGWGWGYTGWFWNPWWGSWAWVPGWDWYLNPYGFGFYSPFTVYEFYPHRFYGRGPGPWHHPAGMGHALMRRQPAARMAPRMATPRTAMPRMSMPRMSMGRMGGGGFHRR
jgi:hypothetical protein